MIDNRPKELNKLEGFVKPFEVFVEEEKKKIEAQKLQQRREKEAAAEKLIPFVHNHLQNLYQKVLNNLNKDKPSAEPKENQTKVAENTKIIKNIATPQKQEINLPYYQSVSSHELTSSYRDQTSTHKENTGLDSSRNKESEPYHTPRDVPTTTGKTYRSPYTQYYSVNDANLGTRRLEDFDSENQNKAIFDNYLPITLDNELSAKLAQLENRPATHVTSRLETFLLNNAREKYRRNWELAGHDKTIKELNSNLLYSRFFSTQSDSAVE